MPGRKKRRILSVVYLVMASLLLLFAAYMACAFWCMEAHGVPDSKLAKLHSGVSSADVRALLGKPGSIHEHDGGHYSWTCTRMTWGMVTIYFSPRDEVTRVEHDH